MTKRLLDSVILIDHLNSIEAASEFIRSLEPRETAISVITYAEIMVGIDEMDKSIIKSFLYQFERFSIDIDIADKAADLRKKYRWKLPDAFQAALAVHHKVLLTTRNIKDFPPEKHGFVEIPYTI